MYVSVKNFFIKTLTLLFISLIVFQQFAPTIFFKESTQKSSQKNVLTVSARFVEAGNFIKTTGIELDRINFSSNSVVKNYKTQNFIFTSFGFYYNSLINENLDYTEDELIVPDFYVLNFNLRSPPARLSII